jgi:RNA polymerase sigma-70 factor (ECF subfamily)
LQERTALQHDDARLKLYLTHRAALIDYATPIVGCRARAEDVVQEAYIRFVPARVADARIEQPVAYLYRIVRNVALDWTRRFAPLSVSTSTRICAPTGIGTSQT